MGDKGFHTRSSPALLSTTSKVLLCADLINSKWCIQNFPIGTQGLFDFTTVGDWDCVAAVERLPALHYIV